MERTLYASVDEMIKAENFSELVGQIINKTCLTPFEPSGWSSTESSFISVDDCGITSPRCVFKRMRKDSDWVMQATEDWNWRAISIWKYGLLDLLPAGLDQICIVGYAHENDTRKTLQGSGTFFRKAPYLSDYLQRHSEDCLILSGATHFPVKHNQDGFCGYRLPWWD